MQINKNKFLIIIILLVTFLISFQLKAAKGTNALKALEPSKALPSYDSIKMPKNALKLETGVDARADFFEYVADNLIATGNVFIRKEDMSIYAHKAIVNNTTKNIELTGNVEFYTLYRTRLEIEYWELEQLESQPNNKVKVVGTVMSVSGRQKLVVDLIRLEMTWKGSRASGNLKTGVFEFGDFVSKFGVWHILADKGRRDSDGTIVARDATYTPSEFIEEGHSVFRIESSKIIAIPPGGSAFPGEDGAVLTHEGRDLSNYQFLGFNNVFYIGDVPVFWLPLFYKPPRLPLGKWNVNVGTSSDWGIFTQLSNSWKVVETPDLSLDTTFMLDWYQKRGWGYGNQTQLKTKDSQTEFWAYGIYDFDTNKRVPDFSRFDLSDHSFRYGVQLKNITNLTDRLSLRGNFTKLSDMYYLYDYFNDIAKIDPQPATYASLEYQFDHFSANLLARPRANSFYSVVQELPQLEISVPRQELFGNLYYQGETSLGYYSMRWRDYKISRQETFPWVNNGPADYDTFRLDSLHFAYYPLKLDWLNVIPRAGVRFTVYSDSSNTQVNSWDLDGQIAADMPETLFPLPIVNYDHRGGGRVRFVPEFGLEANTKISRSWNDVKNAYFDFNGLRHTMVPYFNYTYILSPDRLRNHYYYFDDTDRITDQNFFRIGLENRLQTRRGGWDSSQVYTWATLENYFDFVLNNRDGVTGAGRFLGDFGTKLSVHPTENLNITAELLINTSQFVGLSSVLDPIDKATISAMWQFAENWSISGSYYYGNGRIYPGSYSMGSSLTEMQSGSVFLRAFDEASYLNVRLNSQINERTAAFLTFGYDFKQDLMPKLEIGVARLLPCGLEAMLAVGLSRRKNTSGIGASFPMPSISGSIGFSTSGSYTITPRESLLPESVRRTTLP